jgi:hypothetical protein
MKTSFANMPDQRLVQFYESIRQQVEADRPHKHRLTSSPGIREYADGLEREIIRRGLPHSPIDWT